MAFQALATEELRRVLYIKIEAVLERIEAASQGKPSTVDIAGSARGFMLREGTDMTYSDRPLKRAIERFLGHLSSNLIATGQVRRCNRIRATAAENSSVLAFGRDMGVPSWEAVQRA